MRIANPKPKSPADEKWGFEFGVDGLMSTEQAQDFMGQISRSTLFRRAASGLIRKGKDCGNVVFCRRSVVSYVKTREQ